MRNSGSAGPESARGRALPESVRSSRKRGRAQAADAVDGGDGVAAGRARAVVGDGRLAGAVADLEEAAVGVGGERVEAVGAHAGGRARAAAVDGDGADGAVARVLAEGLRGDGVARVLADEG